MVSLLFFFFQAEDGIRDLTVTGVQTCALPICDGWPLYESRLQLAHMRQLQRTFAAPRWTGAQPLAGKTLLVHADEGLGDTLQFCRYLPVLEARGARVVFEVQPTLKPLLGSLAMRGALVGRGELLPEYDLHIPLL